jgi:hypothetical protein
MSVVAKVMWTLYQGQRLSLLAGLTMAELDSMAASAYSLIEA